MDILITGATKGIGVELVKQFASDKRNNILAIARDIKLLEQIKEYCKQNYDNSIHIYSIDFLGKELNQELKALFTKHHHHFDIVINNAGVLINQPFLENTKDDIYETFQVNVFAPIQVVQSLIPNLNKTKNCHIINIGSMGGFQGSVKFPGLSLYSSSKAALANLTECLAEEYKESNIKINCLALGSVQTEMLNKAFPGFKAQTSPEEMAKYIAEFSQQKPIYFNGKVIPISNSTP